MTNKRLGSAILNIINRHQPLDTEGPNVKGVVDCINDILDGRQNELCPETETWYNVEADWAQNIAGLVYMELTANGLSNWEIKHGCEYIKGE